MGKKLPPIDETKTIYLDDREPDEVYENLIFLITTVKRFEIFNVIRKRLPVGDMVYCDLAAERKAVKDAKASIHDGRIFDQCMQMSLNYNYVFLLIAGELHDFIEEGEERDAKAVMSTIADTELRYNIRTQFCMNEEMLAYYFLMLCYKLYKKVKPTWRVHRVVRHFEDEQISMLAGIKGIGYKIAKEMLRVLKSIRIIKNANIDELKTVKALGDVKAQHIYDIFNKDPEIAPESDEFSWKASNKRI